MTRARKQGWINIAPGAGPLTGGAPVSRSCRRPRTLPRHQHRPESSQLAGFQGSGIEEGLVGEAETGVPDWAGSTIFGPPWSSVRCRAPAGSSRRESRGLAGDLFACARPKGKLDAALHVPGLLYRQVNGGSA